jgi:hypothetical protein
MRLPPSSLDLHAPAVIIGIVTRREKVRQGSASATVKNMRMMTMRERAFDIGIARAISKVWLGTKALLLCILERLLWKPSFAVCVAPIAVFTDKVFQSLM